MLANLEVAQLLIPQVGDHSCIGLHSSHPLCLVPHGFADQSATLLGVGTGIGVVIQAWRIRTSIRTRAGAQWGRTGEAVACILCLG